jgi:hypothetical protein
MLVIGGLRVFRLVVIREPGAQIDHLASLGTEWAEAISLR